MMPVVKLGRNRAQRRLAGFLEEFHRRRDKIVESMPIVERNPSSAAAQKIKEILRSFLTWCDKESRILNSDEVLFAPEYAAALVTTMDSLDKIVSTQPLDETKKSKCLT